MAKRVVLAYSGGLDTSVAVRWMIEEWGVEVVCVLVDVGQDADSSESFDDIKARAMAAGALDCVVVDARDEMAEEFCSLAILANARYEGKYPLVSALSRPVIVRHLVDQARTFNAGAVAHGCTGKGNDQVRFELAYKAIAPKVKIISPWREWTINSREDAIAYANAHKIPVEQTKANIYSRDRNIWHLSHEGGMLEDPVNEPDEAMWQWVASPEKAPNKPAVVEIGFDGGTPVSVNGKKRSAMALLEELNEIAAEHGVGRIDLVENRLVGIKSRGAYETPGGTLLVTAHRELETLCLDRETAHYSEILSLRYAELVYYGTWFTPQREALDAYFTEAQKRVTGTVGLKLYKGNVSVTKRVSPYSLYRKGLASFAMTGYNPKDAEGFINLFALPVTIPEEAKVK
jgi:argininosuccinate synthase